MKQILKVVEENCTNIFLGSDKRALGILNNLYFVGSFLLGGTSMEKLGVPVPKFVPILFFPLSPSNIFLFEPQVKFCLQGSNG